MNNLVDVTVTEDFVPKSSVTDTSTGLFREPLYKMAKFSADVKDKDS